ncbi:licheninase [Neisseria mucosa]|uniref:Licheninase n=1 Tax=Neisseria mucosa TaxID=488 RepID=A0ABN4YCA9_NEIMU|nr:licheninase [Neisseria mucosa]
MYVVLSTRIKARGRLKKGRAAWVSYTMADIWQRVCFQTTPVFFISGKSRDFDPY